MSNTETSPGGVSHRRHETPFYQALRERVTELGGMLNAHVHLDRYGTLDDRYFEHTARDVLESSHVSLHEKHDLIGSVHLGQAYQREDILRRANECLDTMVACNTFRTDTMVDVTDDNVGLSALEALAEVKTQRKQEIDVQIGAYSPFGFTAREPKRWEVFEAGVAKADFIGCLPEADDTDNYPDHIGFMEHCRRVLELAQRENKLVHVHTDQRHESSEEGTERLIEAIQKYGAPRSRDGEPLVWAVHMLSPTTYPEERFQRLARSLTECNVGVICCPSAALGMRQLRPLMTPTYNSIPRLLELLSAGVHVRIGSDNIADMCSPSTTADLTDEVFVLSAALRFYNVDVLARIAAGQRLSDAEVDYVRGHLEDNERQIQKVLRETGHEPAG